MGYLTGVVEKVETPRRGDRRMSFSKTLNGYPGSLRSSDVGSSGTGNPFGYDGAP